MKKIVLSLMLALVLAFGAGLAPAKANPVEQLTGKIWMDSTNDVKKAVLYGVKCAVAMEYITAKVKADQNDKQLSHDEIVRSLTAFPENWLLAFENVELSEIVSTIDKWYTNHPKQIERPVFNVLWYEIMEPKLAQ